MRNTYVIFTFSLCFFCSLLFSQTKIPNASPESQGLSSERLERLNEVMHQFVDDGRLASMQTAVMRNGKLVHLDTYGFKDKDSQTKLEDDDLWRIYSMTKPIVSVGLMMLYEEGRFQLNDPLHKYIPEMKDLMVHIEGRNTEPIKNHIKVVDILRHTSGLGYGWGGGNYVDTLYKSTNRGMLKDNKYFVESLVKIPLYYEPGTGWRYSVSTDVCGYLIEVLSGMPLDQYLQEKILKPMGMVDTHFEVPDHKDQRFVSNYRPTKDGAIQLIDHPSKSRFTKDVTLFSGGGGMVSTIQDYLRFSQMLLNGGTYNGTRLLSPKTIELMTIDHCKGLQHQGGPIVLPNEGHGFGLGFSMVTDLAASGATGSLGAYGWGGAAGTYFRIDPQENLIYVMMIQIMPNGHLQAREKFQTMVYQAIVE